MTKSINIANEVDLPVQWFEQSKINTTRHGQPLTKILSPNFHVIRLEEVSRVGAPISPLVTTLLVQVIVGQNEN